MSNETILTRKVIINTTDALRAIVTADNTKGFTFGAKARYALAKNLRILTGVTADIETARVGLVKEHAEGASKIEPGSEAAEKFMAKWTAFLAETEIVPGLIKIQVDDLDLDNNTLPIEAVSLLLGVMVVED